MKFLIRLRELFKPDLLNNNTCQPQFISILVQKQFPLNKTNILNNKTIPFVVCSIIHTNLGKTGTRPVLCWTHASGFLWMFSPVFNVHSLVYKFSIITSIHFQHLIHRKFVLSYMKSLKRVHGHVVRINSLNL